MPVEHPPWMSPKDTRSSFARISRALLFIQYIGSITLPVRDM